MKTLSVGEFKKSFSEVIKEVRRGEEVAVSFGKKKERIAVLIPFEKYRRAKKRKLGILEAKASFSIKKGFEITDEELLSS
jgi:prevent-host-death family protein